VASETILIAKALLGEKRKMRRTVGEGAGAGVLRAVQIASNEEEMLPELPVPVLPEYRMLETEGEGRFFQLVPPGTFVNEPIIVPYTEGEWDHRYVSPRLLVNGEEVTYPARNDRWNQIAESRAIPDSNLRMVMYPRDYRERTNEGTIVGLVIMNHHGDNYFYLL